jgi:hypothetical protein
LKGFAEETPNLYVQFGALKDLENLTVYALFVVSKVTQLLIVERNGKTGET